MIDHYYKVSFSEKNSFYYRFYNGRSIKDEIIYDIEHIVCSNGKSLEREIKVNSRLSSYNINSYTELSKEQFRNDIFENFCK